ncbi:MAG: PEP-CTERM sorting domain-containing protein [Pirellulaceae bacterium]
MLSRVLIAVTFLTFGPAACYAALVIDLVQVGAGVQISVSGSGTVTAGGNNPGAVINFDNFGGTPWNSNVDGDFSLAPLDAIDLGPATYDTITLDFVGAGTSDFDFRDGSASISISNGDAYNASGTATVTGLLFADLNPGSYVSNSTDSDNFGGVTLNITATAVPEPSSFALLGLCGGFMFIRRRRS